MKVRDRIFNSRNSWGPEKRVRQVQYKSAPPASGIQVPGYAPLVKYQPDARLPSKGNLPPSTQTDNKKARAKDRLRIEHELPWVSYNLKGDTKQKPKQKPQEKPREVEQPDYFDKPSRHPIDLTNYPYASTKTSPTKTAIKAIPKKTPTKTDDEKKEDPLKASF